MDFLTNTTTASSLFEGQWHFLLGQATDSNSLVWICGLFFAAQRHQRDHPHVLGVASDGQGTAVPLLTETKELVFFYRLKRHVAKELRAQRVFAALVKDYGTSYA